MWATRSRANPGVNFCPHTRTLTRKRPPKENPESWRVLRIYPLPREPIYNTMIRVAIVLYEYLAYYPNLRQRYAFGTLSESLRRVKSPYIPLPGPCAEQFYPRIGKLFKKPIRTSLPLPAGFCGEVHGRQHIGVDKSPQHRAH